MHLRGVQLRPIYVLPFIEHTTIRTRAANRYLMYLQFLHKGYACYLQQIKLQEGNIFTGVCLFKGKRWVSIQMRNYKIRSTSGRYTSYWNAFLLVSCHHEDCYMILCTISLSEKQTQKIISQTTFSLTHISFYRTHDEKHLFSCW